MPDVLREHDVKIKLDPEDMDDAQQEIDVARNLEFWTVANILRAEETGEDLSEGKQLTAGELMQAIEDDPRDLRIPTEPPATKQVFGDISDADWASPDAD